MHIYMYMQKQQLYFTKYYTTNNIIIQLINIVQNI